jgi:hypothetical protein
LAIQDNFETHSIQKTQIGDVLKEGRDGNARQTTAIKCAWVDSRKFGIMGKRNRGKQIAFREAKESSEYASQTPAPRFVKVRPLWKKCPLFEA